MNAREVILTAIRAAAVPAAPAAVAPVATADTVPEHVLHTRFLQVLAEVGGEGVVLDEGASLDAQLDAQLDAWLGPARTAALVIPGRCAVAENGAVYVDAADIDTRNGLVLAEHLVVVVPRGAIVTTMHDAVRQLSPASACGWFLSGPSKTADIEQSLVFGAQGSRTHRVIFVAD